MHLQFDGQGPLHAQLTRALKSAVFAGRVGCGARLPPTRLLARELGLSRNTVLAAYEQLRAEGFVAARVGAGSYVSVPLQARPPSLAGDEADPVELPPQSDFADRARRFHDQARLADEGNGGLRYAFQYGVPLTNPVLTSAWARELAKAALYTPPSYPMSQGLPALRKAVCDYLTRRRGVQAAPEDVLIVAGTQQALSLTARILLNEGDTAVIEDPQYYAIRTVLRVHGAHLCGVPVDGEGLVCEALPARGARLVCVTPSHQFPTGALLSLSRRMALLDYAQRTGSWIFEDDYDGEFRYDARPLAALRSLDRHDRVIYVGTFSKVMFPALRLGYLVMPAGLRRDFVAAKWLDDFGSPAIEQAAMANFIADGGFERHLRRTARELKRRRDALLAGLRRYGGDRLQIADSRAGMHLAVWLRGRGRADAEALIARARRRGLGLYSISPRYLDPPDRAGLLMGYGGLSVAEIEQAVALLGCCLDELFPVQGPLQG
ncbi:PLP-dependent aminotransferase family protein [Luteimonas salinilitoris]|uniref:PLP-dependent aminotransferase family protein n=1 Tax=Luteimonas salinilitoris TaxID=3237697 RepID=A0ABV4HLF3_9GAMM